LEKRTNQRLVLLAIRLSHYASVRDQSSAQLLRRVGWHRGILVRPDMGWAWPRLDAQVPVASVPTPAPRRIGINVMSLNDPDYERGISISDLDRDRFDTYIGKLREVVERLLAGGGTVVLFSTETRHDLVARDELLDRMGDDGAANLDRLELQEDLTVDGLLDTMRSCDAIVATRFHAALVALALGRPTVALAYHAKTRDLFDRLGIGALCLGADNFTVDGLLERLHVVNTVWDESRDGVAAEVARLRAEIASQFDQVIGL
jgi:polysaccharide pyruvyl transferase WcaK-like protein